MKINLSCAVFALSLSLLSPSIFGAEEENNKAIIEETVALARSYLGGEENLASVDTIHYQGVLVYGNGQSGTIDSVFKRPNYHQFTSVIGPIKETSTLNRTEAWQKMERLDEPGAWQLDFYSVDDVRHMQATVADALAFLKTPPSRNGRIEYEGVEEINGVKTRVLVYYHSDDIWFRRNIDPETGRVVRMVNDKGVTFAESGEKRVDGVRFPEKVIVSFLTNQGDQTMQMSYSSIVLNEEIDTSRFNVPVMSE